MNFYSFLIIFKIFKQVLFCFGFVGLGRGVGVCLLDLKDRVGLGKGGHMGGVGGRMKSATNDIPITLCSEHALYTSRISTF